MPAKRPAPDANTIAPFTNMNVNAANRAVSIRSEREACDAGAAHHQQTSASQSTRNR
jgi:hypothetical protein